MSFKHFSGLSHASGCPLKALALGAWSQHDGVGEEPNGSVQVTEDIPGRN